MADGVTTETQTGGPIIATYDSASEHYQQILPYPPAAIQTQNRITLTTSSEASLIAAGGAGVFRDICWLSYANSTSTVLKLSILDDTGGTERLSIVMPPEWSDFIPIWPRLLLPTSNKPWYAKLDLTATLGVRITAIAVQRSTLE